MSERQGRFCESWFESISESEEEFYWPGECTRCHLKSHNLDDLESCGNCTIESKGYLPGWEAKERSCQLNSVPLYKRQSIFRRMVGSSRNVSYVRLLLSALRGRRIIWVGDSLAAQFSKFIYTRAQEVGVEVPSSQNKFNIRVIAEKTGGGLCQLDHMGVIFCCSPSP